MLGNWVHDRWYFLKTQVGQALPVALYEHVNLPNIHDWRRQQSYHHTFRVVDRKRRERGRWP